jgi:MFS family permease
MVHLLIAVTFYLLMIVISSFAMETFKAAPSQGADQQYFSDRGLLTRVLCGKWIDRIGRKKTLVLGLVCSVVMTVSYFAVCNIPSLLFVRLLHGGAFGIATTATMTIAANIIPQQRYGEGIAYFMLSATWPLRSAVHRHGAYAVFQLYCRILVLLHSISSKPWQRLLITVPEIQLTAEELNSLKGFKLSNFIEVPSVPISAICGTIFLCYSSVMSFLTAYAKDIDLLGAASFFFIVSAASVLVSRPYLGCLFDLKGENYIMYPAMTIFAAGLFMLSQAYSGLILLSAAVFVGSGSGAVQSCSQAVALKAAPQHRRGITNATVFMFVDLGVGIGPFLFGFIIPLTGYRGLYITAGALATVCIFVYHFLHGGKSAGRISRYYIN